MKWFLLFTLGGTGAVIVFLCLTVLLILHRLRRRNRVRPSEPDDIPLHWLVSPQLAARHHRRLVVASRAAFVVAERHRPAGRRARRQEPPPIVALCEQLVAHAASLDAHLALAMHLPVPRRRRVITHLAGGISEIERTAARLTLMSAEITAPTVLVEHADGMAEMSLRLDALEAADVSLREIEAGAGVTSPSPFGNERDLASLHLSQGERQSGSRTFQRP